MPGSGPCRRRFLWPIPACGIMPGGVERIRANGGLNEVVSVRRPDLTGRSVFQITRDGKSSPALIAGRGE